MANKRVDITRQTHRRMAGIGYQTVRARLKSGWSVEKAMGGHAR